VIISVVAKGCELPTRREFPL